MPAQRSSSAVAVSATVLLWAGFVVVHLWVSWLAIHGPHLPLGDVVNQYHGWVADGLAGNGWVGLDRVWVYPTLALAPLLLSAALGLAAYVHVWLVLVAVLDAVAFAVLTRGGTRRRALGWWWLAFLVLLGPIAVGRLDSITVPIALVGLLLLSRRPALAAVLLTVGTWIKVWPVALVGAVLISERRWMRILVSVLATSVAVVLLAFVFGGTSAAIFGFVGQQTSRGLQVEAPVSTWWLWLEALHVPGVFTQYDVAINTFQIHGPGTVVAAAVMTPVQLVILVGVVLLGWRARHRRVPSTSILGPLALGLTAALIVGNKVGSPQYVTWLAVVVLAGFVLARDGGPSFVLPGVLTLAIAGLTQVVYPFHYDGLLLAHTGMVLVITLRNALLVALLVVAAVQLWRLDGRRLGGRRLDGPRADGPRADRPRGRSAAATSAPVGG